MLSRHAPRQPPIDINNVRAREITERTYTFTSLDGVSINFMTCFVLLNILVILVTRINIIAGDAAWQNMSHHEYDVINLRKTSTKCLLLMKVQLNIKYTLWNYTLHLSVNST